MRKRKIEKNPNHERRLNLTVISKMQAAFIFRSEFLRYGRKAEFSYINPNGHRLTISDVRFAEDGEVVIIESEIDTYNLRNVEKVRRAELLVKFDSITQKMEMAELRALNTLLDQITTAQIEGKANV